MTFKEKIFTRVLTIRNCFIVGNLVLFLLLVAAVVKDNIREWKGYQGEYLQREEKRLTEEIAAADADSKERLSRQLRLIQSQPQQIKQVIVDPLDRVDRCITCHVGFDTEINPTLKTSYVDQPFSANTPDIHKTHPIEKFGCTVCHGGQGLATTAKAAHGDVEHWEKPLMRGALLQASCVKCHGNVVDEKAMPYASAWRRGKQLFHDLGCIGCHQIRGEGGPISVDLAEDTADKPLSRIDFTYTGLSKEQHTLANWIRLHFVKDPQELVPGDPKAEYNTEPIAPSGMPFFNLSNEDADAVTAYVLSFSQDKIPMNFFVPGPAKEEPKFKNAIEHGRYVYEKYGCAGCHAADARGGIRNFNYANDVEPDIRKTVNTYTREELKEKISKGVPIVDKKDPTGPTPPLYMPAWGSKIKGQELDDLATYLFSIGEKEEAW